jgi:hypothetical protein
VSKNEFVSLMGVLGRLFRDILVAQRKKFSVCIKCGTFFHRISPVLRTHFQDFFPFKYKLRMSFMNVYEKVFKNVWWFFVTIISVPKMFSDFY